MASKSPKSKLEKAIQEAKDKSIYANARFEHIGRGCFEVWYGPKNYAVYICMITYIDGKWGATHNMVPNEGTQMFDNPIEAIKYYDIGRR